MKVFIHWSGDRSKQLAEAIHWWLPNVLQFVKPYFSPADIEKGARWANDISKELEQSKIGIIAMTEENLASPWIMFEAGAISKVVGVRRLVGSSELEALPPFGPQTYRARAPAAAEWTSGLPRRRLRAWDRSGQVWPRRKSCTVGGERSSLPGSMVPAPPIFAGVPESPQCSQPKQRAVPHRDQPARR